MKRKKIKEKIRQNRRKKNVDKIEDNNVEVRIVKISSKDRHIPARNGRRKRR